MSSFQEIHVRIADWLLERRKAESEAGANSDLHVSGEYVENKKGGTVFKCPYNPFNNDGLADDYFTARKLVIDDRKNMPIAIALIEAMLEAVVERGAVIDSQNIEKVLDGWLPKVKPKVKKKSPVREPFSDPIWLLERINKSPHHYKWESIAVAHPPPIRNWIKLREDDTPVGVVEYCSGNPPVVVLDPSAKDPDHSRYWFHLSRLYDHHKAGWSWQQQIGAKLWHKPEHLDFLDELCAVLPKGTVLR